jgi:GT2 family glycosyltransferase
MLEGSAPVGVVIVAWNADSCLGECLAALARQTVRPCRVVVIDNASTDGSVDAARVRHPWAEIVRLPRNVGFAAGNNAGIRALHDCPWVALLNPDAFPEPTWIEALLRAARTHPECAAFGSHMLKAKDPRLMDGTGDVYHVSGRAWRRDEGMSADQVEPHGLSEIFAPCAAAALYRRDLLIGVGGFDEDYFCYLEDVDLGFRLRLAGYRSAYVPEAVVLHVGSAVTQRSSDFSVYHGHRNLVWTFFKNMPTALLLLYLPQHLLLNLASVGWFALQGRARLILRAKWDAVVGLRRVWARRNAAQALRKASLGELLAVMSRGWLAAYERWPTAGHDRSLSPPLGDSGQTRVCP